VRVHLKILSGHEYFPILDNSVDNIRHIYCYEIDEETHIVVYGYADKSFSKFTIFADFSEKIISIINNKNIALLNLQNKDVSLIAELVLKGVVFEVIEVD
jgi:hypothetical protein